MPHGAPEAAVVAMMLLKSWCAWGLSGGFFQKACNDRSGSLDLVCHPPPLPASTRKSAPPKTVPPIFMWTLRRASGFREASPERVLQPKEKYHD